MFPLLANKYAMYGIYSCTIQLSIARQWSRRPGFNSRSRHTKRLYKWYLIPPCLTLSNIKYLLRVKWDNPGNWVAPSSTPRCSSYWKGSLLVTLDYGYQLYLLCLLTNNTFNYCVYDHHPVALLAQFPDSLSFAVRLYHPSLLVDLLDGIQYLHKPDVCKSLLVVQHRRVHV